jgi:hypothetical protein
VIVSDVVVRTHSNNLIAIKGAGPRGDAFLDFKNICQGTAILSKGAKIEGATLKFYPLRDRRRMLAMARVQRDSINVADEQLELVHSHLRGWGMYDE